MIFIVDVFLAGMTALFLSTGRIDLSGWLVSLPFIVAPVTVLGWLFRSPSAPGARFLASLPGRGEAFQDWRHRKLPIDDEWGADEPDPSR